ncbi:MAG: PSD1 domain-containing protein [Acidobacteria bacterium]|nr:PSD1 domain-containing protein [Acidobacteriota bacterium]
MRSLFLTAAFPFALAAQDLPRQAAAILEKNCLVCHGQALKSSGLDLRTRESILKGGDGGEAVVPGKPEQSRLYRFVAGLAQPSMPPGKPLPSGQVEVLRRWIEAGAPLEARAPSPDKPDLSKLEERPITEEERRFWSFQPVLRAVVPAGAHAVDYFIDRKLQEKGITPAPRAEKRTLVRRAYLDLIGLPPAPEEVNAFLRDDSPDAWPRLIDRLLAAPHYGERWGRHWLDIVRYADSGGYEFDRDRAQSWRYRDYVIKAFNDDKPYDRFLKEQLAGDEIAPGSPEAMIATGFLRLGPEANIKTEQTRMDELDDILSTTAGAFLGMTLGCARCHNHKFDPIPQKDYYRMQAVFFPTRAYDFPLVPAEEHERYQAEMKRIEGLIAPLKKELSAIEEPYRERLREEKIAALPDYIRAALATPPEKRSEGQKLNAAQVEKTLTVKLGEIEAIMRAADMERACDLRAQIFLLERGRPKLETVMAIGERKPQPSYFLHHGSVSSKGSVMRPGVLSVAAREEPRFPEPAEGAATSGRRRVFAEWVASAENPLSARVMVNRFWQHHFGEGIVRTPNNFGTTGEAPAHPELLDWLASEFVRGGWSMKTMHRLIMTSAAYQRGAGEAESGRRIDPGNRLLWRMPPRRLEGEILRDSVLAVAGTLNRQAGGPGFYPYIDPALWASSSGRFWPGQKDDDPATWRRSVYIFSKRTIPVPMLEVFDKPDTITSCARRNRSTIPTQALILMNNAFVIRQAGHLGERLKRETGGAPEKVVERAFELALARPPTDRERDRAVKFLRANPGSLAEFCQTVFNLNEFAYVP